MPRAPGNLLHPSLAVLSLGLLLGVAQAQTALFSSTGYRTSLYRSPTTDHLDDGRIIDTTNAVKRATEMGYKEVYWYRDGLDAWEAANLPVEAALPEHFP